MASLDQANDATGGICLAELALASVDGADSARFGSLKAVTDHVR